MIQNHDIDYKIYGKSCNLWRLSLIPRKPQLRKVALL
jgi:hypothetical protein